MKILVTGGAGYIGSVFVEHFINSGHEVVILDNLSTGKQELVHPKSKFIYGSIMDLDTLDDLFNTNSFDIVIHLAGKTKVPESVQHPDWYYSVNVDGTKNIVNAMNNHKCRFIFFASTSAIYGEPKKVPIKEDDVALPCNPYGDSKLKGEKIVIDSGVCYCIFRFANVSGASPSKFGGMMQDPPPYLISRLNQNISQGKKPTVMGVNLNTRDGTTIRDYIHVKDLALAIEMYIPFLLNGKSGIYNLGTGTGTTTLEIITNACKIHNIPIQYNETSKRPGDPDILTFSNEKAKITFGWEPKYTIYDMIKSDYDFRNSHKLK